MRDVELRGSEKGSGLKCVAIRMLLSAACVREAADGGSGDIVCVGCSVCGEVLVVLYTPSVQRVGSTDGLCSLHTNCVLRASTRRNVCQPADLIVPSNTVESEQGRTVDERRCSASVLNTVATTLPRRPRAIHNTAVDGELDLTAHRCD